MLHYVHQLVSNFVSLPLGSGQTVVFLELFHRKQFPIVAWKSSDESVEESEPEQ